MILKCVARVKSAGKCRLSLHSSVESFQVYLMNR